MFIYIYICNSVFKFKYREEKDELELKCIMLKKDSKMYRDRMEDILKQLEEVIKERDKVSHFPLCVTKHIATSCGKLYGHLTLDQRCTNKGLWTKVAL